MSWRPNQQSKPWPWPNAVYLEEGNEDSPPAWGNVPAKKYENPEGQILGGTVYKNAFPVPGDHYIYKSKKTFKDKYAKNKAKFDKKAKLPPITEAMSESSKAGSTRSTRSWMIPRYNPDILSDVMASDESNSDDDDYTSGRGERKYRKSGRRSNNQPSSLRHVDVIRNVQATRPAPRSQPKVQNTEVWPPERARRPQSRETRPNQNYDGLHRSPMNGNAVLANHLMMNNGSVYKERHPLGMTPTAQEDTTALSTENWGDNTYRRQNSHGDSDISRRQSTRSRRRRRKSSTKNNCLITCVVIAVIFSLLGAGVAIYLLLREPSSDTGNVTSPPINIRTLKYDIILHLVNGNYSSSLEDNNNDAFISLEDEVCEFLGAVPMRDYLNIYRCEVTAFREGSIRTDLGLYFREDHITVLKARNDGLTEHDIIVFIEEDISNGIGGNSEKIKQFVEKYNPSVGIEQPVTLTPTTETSAIDESSATEAGAIDESSSNAEGSVTPSMTETAAETSTSEMSVMIAASLEETHAISDTSSILPSAQVINSNSETINISPTETQNPLESSSAS